MNTSTFQGIVENGQIRVLGDAKLPENATVYIVLQDATSMPPARIASPRLVNPADAVDFVKQVFEAPLDAPL
ncbi:MAG: hypothetical protein AB7G28_22185 [Pirellulales bacterium]